MVKKVNQDGIRIKTLKKLGLSPSNIEKKLKISKQKVNYWLKTEIKTEIKRKTKLDDIEIDRVVDLAKNKTTSNMGSRKIAEIINEELKTKRKIISKSSICNYLNKRKMKPRKILFQLNN